MTRTGAMEGFSKHKDILWQELHQQVERALVLLDEPLVQEYREAFALAPQLVAKESRTADFLRTENYHPLLAAKRLAMYWKTRKQLYGSERWLKPLSMSGHGALTPEQIGILQSGFQVVLTEPTAVFIEDLSRCPQGVDHFQPQIIFYLLSISTCINVQTGLSILHVIHDGYRPLILPRPPMLKQLTESLPIQIKQIIVARTVAALGREHLLDYRAYEQRRVCDVNSQAVPAERRAPVECLSANSLEELLELLQEKGLHPDVLPRSLGGTYEYDRDFGAWVRARTKVEQGEAQKPHVPTNDEGLSMTTSLTSSSQHHSELSIASLEAAGNEPPLLVRRAPGESDEAFRQRRNSVYAKRFAQKQKWSLVESQAKHKMLKVRNGQLLAEQKRLEGLLAKARQSIADWAFS